MTILDSSGKTYTRTDKPATITIEDHRGAPARPYDIPIKGAWGKRSGILSTTSVALVDATLKAVAYPNRGGAYNPRMVQIMPRPFYYVGEGDNRRMVYKVQCIVCEEYQKREAFSPDKRKANGLDSRCKTCEAQRKQNFRRRAAA